MTLAKAFVTGKVLKAPEKRFTQNDVAIAGFTISLDKTDETLIRVTTFGQLAETATSTLSLNDFVAVEGKLQVNSYKLPNGKDKKVFEIAASSIEKMSGEQSVQQTVQPKDENIVSFNQDETQDLIDEDEIPF